MTKRTQLHSVKHYEIEIKCHNCDSYTLLSPSIGNKEYNDFCEYCGEVIIVKADQQTTDKH